MKHGMTCTLMIAILVWAGQAHALSGDVSGVWSAGNTIVIDGDVTVPAGETLTIEAGTQILFNGWYAFTVNGLLEATGTETDMIVFTRADDTDDTKWAGIRFDGADDTAFMEYCRVEYVHREVYGINTRGGGIWIDDCSPAIRYCILTQNYSRNENRNGCGGGICLSSDSNSVLEFNIITGNEADSGGGIFVGSGCNAVIRNNRITGNESYSSGGGIYVAAWSYADISHNTIRENQAFGWAGGGGITVWNAYCREDGCTRIYNNFITGNTAASWGGGIYSRYSESMIYNNTLTDNTADTGGGIHVLNQGNMVPPIFNCVVWGNDAADGPQVYFYMDTTEADISYCNIEGGFDGSSNDIGNIDADPVFADADNGNYRLAGGSACIDAGDNDATPLPDTDYDGDHRLADDPDTPDTGSGTAPIVDMGADEFLAGACPADLDLDGDADEADLEILSLNFGGTVCLGGCQGDETDDGDVDGLDLAAFAIAYLTCQ